MDLIVILFMFAQYSGAHPAPTVTIDTPIIQVTGIGTMSIDGQTTAYAVILYADSYDEEEKEAREKADRMKNEILTRTKTLGGSDKDVTITNLTTLDPIENDPYYRVEQDIQIHLTQVKDINKVKEQYLTINGVQIGSVTPVMEDISDLTPVITKARQAAVKNAQDAAAALAIEMNVVVGEAVYVAEHIAYPAPGAYEGSGAREIIVTVTVCYDMIRKK